MYFLGVRVRDAVVRADVSLTRRAVGRGGDAPFETTTESARASLF